MGVRLVNNSGYLLYDPTIYGYDENVFKTIGGVVNVINEKICLSSGGEIITTSSFLLGKHIFSITIPTVPSVGDSRIFGFYSESKNGKDAAYFFINGSSFYARTYGNNSSIPETTVIPWDPSWTNAATKFEIRMYIGKVEFYINGRNVINTVDSNYMVKNCHNEHVPVGVLLPMYFFNGQVDFMSVNFLESKDIRKIFYSKKGWYSPSSFYNLSTQDGESLLTQSDDTLLIKVQ